MLSQNLPASEAFLQYHMDRHSLRVKKARKEQYASMKFRISKTYGNLRRTRNRTFRIMESNSESRFLKRVCMGAGGRDQSQCRKSNVGNPPEFSKSRWFTQHSAVLACSARLIQSSAPAEKEPECFLPR